MKTTRKDVAKKAGVSEQTVSYILNNSRKFSPDVVNRVQQAVEELSYKPNMAARSLLTNRSYTISVIVHDIANPIFNEIMVGLQRAAHKSNYFVTLSDPHGDIDKYVVDLISRNTDAVFIYVLAMYQDISFLKDLIDCDIKVVIGGNVEISDSYIAENVSILDAHHSDGVRQILEYLYKIGHEDIVYLSGLGPESKLDFRYRAFKEHYYRIFNRKPVILENIPPYDTSVKIGYRMAKKLLNDGIPVTAVVATNDLMAYGVIDAFKEEGISVPEDISVIGIDDMMFSKYFDPSLTSLSFDKEKYGERVFEKIYSLINKTGKHDTSLVKTKLKVRNSTMPLR